MRPNHQNKRMRGRNRGGGNGGGKGPNPLTRTYESNGPEVKVRGTAQSIAEKYLQLGRDAQASGDHVQAESFFQHAEHYFRLVAAAQEQYRIQNPGFRGFDQTDGEGDEGEDEGSFVQGQAPSHERGFAGSEGEDEASGSEQMQQREPREHRQPRHQRDNRPFQQRDNRNFQPRDGGNPDQREGTEQASEDGMRDPRPSRDGNRFDRGPREPRFQRPAPMPLDAEQPGLPSFITAPVRPLVVSDEPVASVAEPVDPSFGEPIGVRRRGRPPRPREPMDNSGVE